MGVRARVGARSERAAKRDDREYAPSRRGREDVALEDRRRHRLGSKIAESRVLAELFRIMPHTLKPWGLRHCPVQVCRQLGPCPDEQVFRPRLVRQLDEQRLCHSVEEQDAQLGIRIARLSRPKEGHHDGEAASQVGVREAERDQPAEDCSRRRPAQLGDARCRGLGWGEGVGRKSGGGRRTERGFVGVGASEKSKKSNLRETITGV